MKLYRIILPFLSLASIGYAKNPQEIANDAAAGAYYQGDDGRAHVTMSITDKQGRERVREFTILRRDVEDDLGDQQFYVFFRKPADVADTAFLVNKHPGKDDDRWLYLPALDLVRRIAASDERTSFVGSHFFYEDVSGRSPDEDTHELLEETEHYYVLKSSPKNKAGIEFAYFKSWIHKGSSISVKTEFYDEKDQVYRVYEAVKVEDIQGKSTVTQSKMTDHQRGGSTTLSYSTVQYDSDLDPKIFGERYLRTPPARFLDF